MRALAVLPLDLPAREAQRPFAATDVEDIARSIAHLAQRWLKGDRGWKASWDVMELASLHRRRRDRSLARASRRAQAALEVGVLALVGGGTRRKLRSSSWMVATDPQHGTGGDAPGCGWAIRPLGWKPLAGAQPHCQRRWRVSLSRCRSAGLRAFICSSP